MFNLTEAVRLYLKTDDQEYNSSYSIALNLDEPTDAISKVLNYLYSQAEVNREANSPDKIEVYIPQSTYLYRINK